MGVLEKSWIFWQ